MAGKLEMKFALLFCNVARAPYHGPLDILSFGNCIIGDHFEPYSEWDKKDAVLTLIYVRLYGAVKANTNNYIVPCHRKVPLIVYDDYKKHDMIFAIHNSKRSCFLD